MTRRIPYTTPGLSIWWGGWTDIEGDGVTLLPFDPNDPALDAVEALRAAQTARKRPKGHPYAMPCKTGQRPSQPRWRAWWHWLWAGGPRP